MRRYLIFLVLLLGSLNSAQAGIYATSGMPPGPEFDGGVLKPMPAAWFRDNLVDRIGILLEQPVSERLVKKRQDHLDKIQALQTKLKAGTATLDDKINLSANFIWVGKLREAIELLEPLARAEGRANFMVLSNLATAYQLSGQMERVPDYLLQARACWPDEAPGIDKQQLKWYRNVEKQQLRLVLLRKGEASRQPAGVRKPPEGVDALFGEPDPVRYVGDSGAYEPGKLAAAEKAKLPPDALGIVQQLVLWLPDDTRLLWQAGELQNAGGQIKDGYDLLDECVGASRRYDSNELKEHRRILHEELQKLQQAQKPPPPPSGLPDTSKLLMVGGVAGVLILFFGYLQVRQMRRRAGRVSVSS